MGAENDATGVSKRIDSPAPFLLLRQNFVIRLWGDLQQREITLRSIRFPKPTRREGNCKRVRKIRIHMNVVPRSTMNTNGETEN